MRVVLLTLLCVAVPAIGHAQTVELMFTPGVVQQAVALKGALKADKVESFSAMALVGASAEQKKAYGDKVASSTAVVIVGEDALKAAADVEFTVPIIVINANGRTAARNRVVRVFDGTMPAPAGVTTVYAGDSVARLLGTAKTVSLRGPVAPIVQALVAAFK
jgi:hypothetical protein